MAPAQSLTGSGAHAQGAAPEPPAVSADEESALRKVGARLVPFMALLYFAAFIDRVNVGFAAAQMNRDLGFSSSVYGFGAGVFFIGYCLFEVPSNLILHRMGGRRWLARIMLSWSVVAGAMAFVRGEHGFFALRFLLGIAEAGFFPGVIYYLTYWVPAEARARLVGRFMVAIPLSTAVGGPLSGAILGLDGRLGLAGWQWLFLLETIPSLILGVITWRFLPDTPADARWLNHAEREALHRRLTVERGELTGRRGGSVLRTLADPRVLALSICYFGVELGLYGVIFWIPQIFQRMGLSTAGGGYMVAATYAVAAVIMVAWSRRSDRRRERVRHIAAASLAGCLGLAASALLIDSPPLAALAIAVGAGGSLAVLPIFWTLPTAVLTGAAAAGAIALINAIGNVGGFAGPYVIGLIRDATGGFTWGLFAAALGVLSTGVIALLIGRWLNKAAAGAA